MKVALALILLNIQKWRRGGQVQFGFIICLHIKDFTLLEYIKIYLGAGHIYKTGAQFIRFIVSSEKELFIILEHFDNYSLITQKLADYILFKKAF